ncbi:MAG: molybdopterin molybdenumtransferase MoeA [Ahrensia sp.]|jgi:molybdopterin molybdotransferase|nr:molybdopterin molybdenumtransferase MoeA [Ahrensia sp.]
MQPEIIPDERIAEFCCSGMPGDVLPVDIAGAKAIAAAVPVNEVERLPLIEASGRISASDIASAISLPLFDNSAMDGYAVRTRDFTESGPWRFFVSGRIPAGDGSGRRFPPASAVRIFTGAPLPAGFDAVVMQENCQRSDDTVTFAAKPTSGQNNRRGGEDVSAGSTTVAAGSLLTPGRIALLAATGVGDVEAWRRMRVALISTGSELREPGRKLGPGQIYNSNRYFLRSALAYPWAEIADYGIVGDDPETIRAVVRDAARVCDVVITTGGVSVGEEDHMMDVLRRENAELEVLKVSMRPGKPVTVGTIGNALFFGLPGNPYAAAVTFSRIALPAIKATAGLSDVATSWMPAVSGFSYRRKPGRTEYVPVTWARRDTDGKPVVEMLGRGSSASLNPMASARATAVLPPDMASIEPGMPLRIEPFCE